jgi:26S proteasome regulatory subunit N8
MDNKPNLVVVHPLVLLSVVDHYNRVSKDTNNRVAGVLLGSVHKGVVDVTNSFAVPFEEDAKDPSIWFFDHNYVETMFGMFRRVAAREVIVGWYSTGPKIKKNDIDIHELFKRYLPNPVYVIIDVKPKDVGIPTDAFISIEEVQDEKSQPKLTFAHVASEMGALEAEEIGVEHLLRDVKDTTVSDLHSSVSTRLTALKALRSRLSDIHKYLQDVVANKLSINHQILYNLQDVFNLLPGLQIQETQDAFITETNDTMLVMYISSIIRCVSALHNLINNQHDLRLEEVKDIGKLKSQGKEEKKPEEKKVEDGADSKKSEETKKK